MMSSYFKAVFEIMHFDSTDIDSDLVSMFEFTTTMHTVFITHVKLFMQEEFFKGTVMQTERVLINDRLCVSKVSRKFCILFIYNFSSNLPVKLAFFLKSSLLFNNFYCLFCL